MKIKELMTLKIKRWNELGLSEQPVSGVRSMGDEYIIKIGH
jgi:hypothetical protein